MEEEKARAIQKSSTSGVGPYLNPGGPLPQEGSETHTVIDMINSLERVDFSFLFALKTGSREHYYMGQEVMLPIWGVIWYSSSLFKEAPQ